MPSLFSICRCTGAARTQCTQLSWCAGVCSGAAKVLGGLQTFKVKYAEARAKDHPELAQVYTDKIAAMKAAGELTGLYTVHRARS